VSVLLLLGAGVNGLFTKTGCDRSSIDEMLSAQEGCTDQNLLQYVGIVEARANQLLLTRAYILKHQVSIAPDTPSTLQSAETTSAQMQKSF